MSTTTETTIKHWAGRITAETLWPNPDTSPGSLQHTQNILDLIGDLDLPIAVASLATAGVLITTLHGQPPTNPPPQTTLGGIDAIGWDLGIGFTTHTTTPENVPQAIDLLTTLIADYPTEQQPQLAAAALVAIITRYTTGWTHDN